MAVIDENAAFAHILVEILADHGWRAAAVPPPTNETLQLTTATLHRLDACACVYDVGFPHERTWELFLALRRRLPRCRFVLTTTDRRRLGQVAGLVQARYAIAKPYTPERIAEALRQALDQAEPDPAHPSDRTAIERPRHRR